MADLRATAPAYLRQVFGACAAEVQKLRLDPFELATHAIQPVLWLVLFGEVMSQVRGFAPGGVRYLDFLSAGILTQSVLFVAIFYGIAAIWERDLGILHRDLASPAPARRWCSARRCRPACAGSPRPRWSMCSPGCCMWRSACNRSG
jgi:ABC-2 type transport system permease protein